MSRPGHHPSEVLVGQLGAQLADRVRAAVPRGSTVALVDFPHHDNIGDTAIWMGERALLRDLAANVAAVADESSYSAPRIRRAIGPDGVVLLHGGGSFGDLWPRRQAFREKVIDDFPDHRIVQLPQTVSVTSASALGSMRSRLRAHGGVVLLVRDHRSAETCRSLLGVAADVVPDAAFALGPLARPCRASSPVLCLARTDHEAVGPVPRSDPGVVVVDWFAGMGTGSVRRRLHVRGRRLAAAGVARGPVSRLVLGPMWEAGFDRAARRRLEIGTRLLSRGEVVVTDRLHGHILSLLLGIPHVVVDTRHGKVGAFLEAFTGSSALVHRAADFAEAQRLALSLAP